MKERSVICRPHEVLAILNGTQTQIRRPITKLSGFGKITEFQRSQTNGYDWQFRDKRALWNDIYHRRLMQCSPYGAGGDVLWVRETTHRQPMINFLTGEPLDEKYDGGAYSADSENVLTLEGFDFSWWYSPRWASRITLEVTGVRVERLQDISEADVLAEGIAKWPLGYRVAVSGAPRHESRSFETPTGAYRWLWESINGPGSWDANPWAWVVEFRRIAP